MSLKLDAVAYHKRNVDYRLRRLEKVVSTLSMLERGCHILPDNRKEYFTLLKEIRDTINNNTESLSR